MFSHSQSEERDYEGHWSHGEKFQNSKAMVIGKNTVKMPKLIDGLNNGHAEKGPFVELEEAFVRGYSTIVVYRILQNPLLMIALTSSIIIARWNRRKRRNM